LTRGELALLREFVRRPGRVLSRDQLLDAVVGRRAALFDRSIDVLVGRLRRKIEPDPKQPSLIVTVPGEGYRFSATLTSAKPVDEVAEKGGAQPAWQPPVHAASWWRARFANLSGDPEQEFFADGITDDLTTDLSHLPDSFVIARNTAFTYKGKPVELKQLGRELGVRYALEGSVQRLGEKISINAQLISTGTGANVWADRFDGERSRLGELQVDFVARLARSLEVELFRAESLRAMRERVNNPDAVDLAMRGWAAYYKQRDAANTNEAIGYFERALQLDPQLPQALLGLSQALSERANNYWSANPTEDVDRADVLVSRVLSDQPGNARAHLAKGMVYFGRKQWESAIAEENAAIADDRNLAEAHAFEGFWQIFIGRAADGLPGIETALRLSPQDPARPFWEFTICHVYAHMAQWDRAIDWCGKSSASNPTSWYPYIDLAAAYSWTGRDAEARAAMTELQKLWPGITLQKWLALDFSKNPTFLSEYRRIGEGMRKAGLPED
jgi:adenylate cyclase